MHTLTHFNQSGQAHMVDISEKKHTKRIAIASGKINMQAATFKLIQQGNANKGDVLGIARIAAIQGCKKTAELIPLCHPLLLTHIHIEFALEETTHQITCTAQTETTGATGVEIEALTAVSVALLTIYDMCKSTDRAMSISDIHLLQKRGGKSGDWINPAD